MNYIRKYLSGDVQITLLLRRPDWKSICLSETQSEFQQNDLNSQIKDLSFTDDSNYLIFIDNEPVVGKVIISTVNPDGVTHSGVHVIFSGKIVDNTNSVDRPSFVTLSKLLIPPGILLGTRETNFDFGKVTRPYESYNSDKLSIRYQVTASISHGLIKQISRLLLHVKKHTAISNIQAPFLLKAKMADAISFKLLIDRRAYDVDGIIYGSFEVTSSNCIIKSVSIFLSTIETVLTGSKKSNSVTSKHTYEIVSGSPLVSDFIPFRFHLKPLELQPTMKSVNEVFTVSHHFGVRVIDMSDHCHSRYEQIEIYRMKK